MRAAARRRLHAGNEGSNNHPVNPQTYKPQSPQPWSYIISRDADPSQHRSPSHSHPAAAILESNSSPWPHGGRPRRMMRPLQPRHVTAATIVAVGVTTPAAYGGPRGVVSSPTRCHPRRPCTSSSSTGSSLLRGNTVPFNFDFITPVHTQFPWPLGASRPTGFRLAPFQRSSSPAAVDSNPRAGLYIQQAALCAWHSGRLTPPEAVSTSSLKSSAQALAQRQPNDARGHGLG